MRPRIIFAIARKDAIDIWLNRVTLGGLIYPIVMSFVFLLISRLVGGSSTGFFVYNPGGSGVVQAVSGSFPNSKLIQAGSAEEVSAAFGPDGTRKTGPYALGMIVPADFDSALRSGDRPQLYVYLNGATL